MKKALGILLLGIQLLAATELHQLLKTPALLQHFSEHRSNFPEMSVWEFLAMHYDHDAPIDEDHEHDMKLPFKQCLQPSFVWTCEKPEWKICFSPEKHPIRLCKVFTCADQVPLPKGAESDVWHPPKA
jgi:hypothetical protein